MATEEELLKRITLRPDVFGSKPIVRDLRIAVEHIMGMLAARDTPETILEEYPFLEPEDIQACLLYAHRAMAGERVYERTEMRHPFEVPPLTAAPCQAHQHRGHTG